MLSTLTMESAKRGWVLCSERRRYEMFQFLKTTYGSLFTHREFEFDAIYEKVQFQLSAIIYELRQEIREIVSFHNLTLAGIVYTPVDLVMCRYSYRTPDELDITSLRNAQ